MKSFCKFFKVNRLEILIFGFSFFIMVFFALQNRSMFDNLWQFFSNSEVKESITIVANENNMGPIQYVLSIPFLHPQPFDEIIIGGTVFFQIIIPFIAAVTCIKFYKNHIGISAMKYYRFSRLPNAVMKNLANSAFKVTLSIFAAYLLFLIIAILCGTESVFGTHPESELPRTIILDLVGKDFYLKHTVLYWSLEGGIRFFLVPFVYASCSCIVTLITKSIKYGFIITTGYYLILSALMGALSSIKLPFHLSLYLNPSVIMASGSYDLATIPLLFFLFLPLIILIVFLFGRKAIIYD